MFQFPTTKDLRPTFEQVAASQFNGVNGVLRLKIGQPKVTATLIAGTHGDEPSGLGAIRAVLDNQHLLQNVDLQLVLGNIDGLRGWFDATAREAKHKCRATGWNHNRIPLGFTEGYTGPALPALDRALHLHDRVWMDVQYALDMHSADAPLNGGLTLDIAGSDSELDRLSDVIPVHARFKGMSPKQAVEGSKTASFSTLVGRGKATSLEVESDSHESPIGIEIATTTAFTFLLELGCLKSDANDEKTDTQDVYDVLGAVMVPCDGYSWVSDDLLVSFAPVKEGQVLLTGPEGDVLSQHDGRLIFTATQRKLDDGDYKEEVAFMLSHGVKNQRTIRTPQWLRMK